MNAVHPITHSQLQYDYIAHLDARGHEEHFAVPGPGLLNAIEMQIYVVLNALEWNYLPQ